MSQIPHSTTPQITRGMRHYPCLTDEVTQVLSRPWDQDPGMTLSISGLGLGSGGQPMQAQEQGSWRSYAEHRSPEQWQE